MMLTLYRNLFNELNSTIRYAAWKDCHNLSEFLKGDGDVDLLVDSDQKNDFEKKLADFGFIEAESSVLKFTSVRHFYGYDIPSGRICHLNIYYKMNTGASHIKSHELPLAEKVFKNRFVNEHGIYETMFWVQSLIYTMRHHLKRSSIFGFLLWIREKASYQEEYKYIKSGLSKEVNRSGAFSEDSDEVIRSSLFDFNNLSLGIEPKFFFISKRAARELSDYKRFGTLKNIFRSVRNFLALLYIRLKSEKKNLCSYNVIAVTGVDGAGKSSMVIELRKWLGENFNISSFHVGNPPATLLTFPVRVLILFRGLLVGRGAKQGGSNQSDRLKKPSVLYAVRYLALSYERYCICKKIEKAASKGTIVITDRYVGNGLGKMDSPQIGTGWSGIVGFLGRLENRFYEKINEASVVLFLNVSVEEAKKRNRNRQKSNKETDNEIEMRYMLNKDLEFKTDRKIIIDADQSFKSVLRNMKEESWNSLIDSPDVTLSSK